VTDNTRTQSVRNAWTNALRNEVLRVHTQDIAKVGNIGAWIATYADADGGGAFPSRETIATLAGTSAEAVTRAVKVLTAVGMLTRRRRPNQPSMYQLLMPLGRPDWAAHMHLFTETRQRSWHAEKKRLSAKEQTADEPDRTASTDAIRIASAVNVPDSVHGRGPTNPDSVHGRPRNASTDGIRTASTDAPTNTDLPTVGTPPEDQNVADAVPQPQVPRGRTHTAKRDHSEPPRQRPILAAVPGTSATLQNCPGCDRAHRSPKPDSLCRDCRCARDRPA
jgi:hypothetical protein